MTTALQQMIDFVTNDDFTRLYPNVKSEWFKTFLEKEKQQIIDAYIAGQRSKKVFDFNDADKYFDELGNK